MMVAAVRAVAVFVLSASAMRADLLVAEGPEIERYSSTGTDLGTFGTTTTNAFGMTMDASGNLYVSSASGHDIYEFTPGGTRSVFATTANGTNVDPFGLAFESNGDLLAADRVQDNIDVYSSTGVWQEELTSGYTLKSPDYLAVDSSGDVFVSNGNNAEVDEFSPQGVFIQKITQDLETAYGIHFDAQGNLWVMDEFGGVVREYSITGSTYTEIGSRPLSIDGTDFAFDSNGDLYDVGFASSGELQSGSGGKPTDIATLAYTLPESLLDTTVASPAPEPGTLYLAGLGLLAAGVILRLQKNPMAI